MGQVEQTGDLGDHETQPWRSSDRRIDVLRSRLPKRRQGRRHRAQLFDEHAPVVLAFANLLLGDPLRAADVAGVVLLREIPRTAPDVPTWVTRRAYAAAVLAECEDHERERAAIDPSSIPQLAYATVGLAVYAGLSYRQIAADLHLNDAQTLELLRQGLQSVGENPPRLSSPFPRGPRTASGASP